MKGMEMMLKSMGVDMGQVEKVVDGVRAIAASLEDMQQRITRIEGRQLLVIEALQRLEERNGRSLAKCG